MLLSTACWRGYQGFWEIQNGRFFLRGLRGKFELVGEEPLFADWFSGMLRIPDGELIEYIHMGFASVYEREIHIKIDQGVVVSSETIENRGKEIDPWDLGFRNMPGGENRFDGDDRG